MRLRGHEPKSGVVARISDEEDELEAITLASEHAFTNKARTYAVALI